MTLRKRLTVPAAKKLNLSGLIQREFREMDLTRQVAVPTDLGLALAVRHLYDDLQDALEYISDLEDELENASEKDDDPI